MNILYSISCFIALSCAMERWQFFLLGVKLRIYDVLVLLFITFSFIILLVGRTKFSISQSMKTYLRFQWFWLIFVALSGLHSILGVASDERYASLYIKGVLTIVSRCTFFTCFLCFLSNLSIKKKEKILTVYIYGVLLSAFYLITSVFLLHRYGIYLDSLIWDQISYNIKPASKSLEKSHLWAITVGGWSFYKERGMVGGPHPQAVYITSVLPLFVLQLSRGRYWCVLFVFFCGIAMLLTISRSGWISLLVALFFLSSILLKQQKKKYIWRMLSIGLAFCFSISVTIYILLGDNVNSLISQLLHARLSLAGFEVAGSRAQIYLVILKEFLYYPFGVGYNAISVWSEIDTAYPGQFNGHSTWLTHLIETGLLSVFYQMSFSLYIIKTIYRSRRLDSIALLSSYIGICLGAVINNNLNFFFMDYFIILALFVCHSENVQTKL